MGDRCHLEMTIAGQDLQKFNEALQPEYEGLEDIVGLDRGEWTDPVLDLSDSEANYGHHDELQTLAKAGCIFVGHHGEGGDYGACAFCGIDGKYYEVDMGHDGSIMCAIDGTTGAPMTEPFANIQRFIDAERRANEYIEAFRHVCDDDCRSNGCSEKR